MINANDDRRKIIIPGNQEETIIYCGEHFIECAKKAIDDHDFFSVALSGGSTPKAIFNLLATPLYRSQLNWEKVKFFWSDERCVSPDNEESNYHMAMQAGISSLAHPNNIFRMPGEREDLEQAAKDYQKIILENTLNGEFDLVTLGMGDDGHTASLFPQTAGLHKKDQLVISNYVPQKNTWRLSFTYECINKSHQIVIYVLGKGKASMVKEVFSSSERWEDLPIQRIGTVDHPALWILDAEAASKLS